MIRFPEFIDKNRKDLKAIYEVFRRIFVKGNERSFRNILIGKDGSISVTGRPDPKGFDIDLTRYQKKYKEFFISDMRDRTDEYHDVVVSMELDRLNVLGSRKWHSD